MQEHVEAFGLSKRPRHLLVGGLRAQKILLATPLLKWYLEHGLQVSQIHQVVEYIPMNCFTRFVQRVSDARRSDDPIMSETQKLIGNSAYGSMIMDKLKHGNVKYIRGETKACLKANQVQFKKLVALSDDMFEIEMHKKKIKLDLPIQIGYFILQYAKLRMLEFYYDFMDVYVDRSDFEYCEMDTDSAYIAISAPSLAEIIKPEKKIDYMRGLKGFCEQNQSKADSIHRWFPRTCCQKHAAYDKREPGLFKLEYSGDEMIGLCSKTYIVKNGEDFKFSAKGLNKQKIENPLATFRDVIHNQSPASGINMGFVARENTMFTYTQQRCAFSYFYCKRRVLDDGVTTVPLDLTLTPSIKYDCD